ncbi:hypothetical protein Fmac_026588 [Flemingia macrophylla]|uniref:DUF7745 domain-containing protein n=1 Tax=Flemingia macrophylla TaxID=520843 RepID=A0ABD1LFB0_9FABA
MLIQPSLGFWSTFGALICTALSSPSLIWVANLIKLPPHQSALVGNENIKGWKFKALKDHLITLASIEDWVAFNKTLALIVFGTILFPFHTDTVDHMSMDAFFAWDVHSKSPIPTILADTMLSVDFCHQKQGKTLRGSSTLVATRQKMIGRLSCRDAMVSRF